MRGLAGLVLLAVACSSSGGTPDGQGRRDDETAGASQAAAGAPQAGAVAVAGSQSAAGADDDGEAGSQASAGAPAGGAMGSAGSAGQVEVGGASAQAGAPAGGAHGGDGTIEGGSGGAPVALPCGVADHPNARELIVPDGTCFRITVNAGEYGKYCHAVIAQANGTCEWMSSYNVERIATPQGACFSNYTGVGIPAEACIYPSDEHNVSGARVFYFCDDGPTATVTEYPLVEDGVVARGCSANCDYIVPSTPHTGNCN